MLSCVHIIPSSEAHEDTVQGSNRSLLGSQGIQASRQTRVQHLCMHLRSGRQIICYLTSAHLRIRCSRSSPSHPSLSFFPCLLACPFLLSRPPYRDLQSCFNASTPIMGRPNHSSRACPPAQLARRLQVLLLSRLPLRVTALLPLGATQNSTQARHLAADAQRRPAQ